MVTREADSVAASAGNVSRIHYRQVFPDHAFLLVAPGCPVLFREWEMSWFGCRLERIATRSFRMREIPSSAAGDNSEGRFLMLHQPMARVVQVVALIAFTFTCVIALGTSHTAGQLAFSSDGRKLVGTVNGYTWPHPNDLLFMYGVIKIWDAGSGRTLARLAGPGTWLRALVISPDDSTLALAGDARPIELWDLVRETRKGVLTGHVADVMQLTFAPSGEILASASVDGEVRLWDIATSQTRITLHVDQYGVRAWLSLPMGADSPRATRRASGTGTRPTATWCMRSRASAWGSWVSWMLVRIRFWSATRDITARSGRYLTERREPRDILQALASVTRARTRQPGRRRRGSDRHHLDS